MRLIPNCKWPIPNQQIADEIRQWLVKNGGEEEKVSNPHEDWRVKYSDATITFYKKGTLFITDSNDYALLEVHNFINSLVGPRFTISKKEFLIGCDETGKGEVFGHIVLVGVLFPNDIYQELEQSIGVADTKISHTVQYWDDLMKKIDFYRDKGLKFFIETIPPWQVDKYNINKLLDLTYQRILLSFARKIDLKECRIVLDDYGVGQSLNRYLKSLENGGAEIIKTSKADENYLESRVASLIAKWKQQKVLEAVTNNPEFQLTGNSIGSGNAGDSTTIAWLREWHKTGREWPWFVKKSFKTIQQIERSNVVRKKLHPPINEYLLSEEFRKKFEGGELNIKTLAFVCPYCGESAKSIKLLFKNDITTASCINCRKDIRDLALALRYYCGSVLPDSNVLMSGFISKDLSGTKFFENFSVLIHPVVKKESDAPGGKKEFERLGLYASIGRIKLIETSSLLDSGGLENIKRDEVIQLAAVENEAILITADRGMKGSAQAKGLFVFEI